MWLDPEKAILQVAKIRDGFVRADPGGASEYESRASSLIDELKGLHDRFSQGLARCQHRHFVTSHSAFGHLASRYGLEEGAIAGIAPEASPSPKDLASIVDRIEELGIGFVFVEPTAGTALAETVANEIGAALLTLHPLETVTTDEQQRGETYFSLMASNLANLRDGPRVRLSPRLAQLQPLAGRP